MPHYYSGQLYLPCTPLADAFPAIRRRTPASARRIEVPVRLQQQQRDARIKAISRTTSDWIPAILLPAAVTARIIRSRIDQDPGAGSMPHGGNAALDLRTVDAVPGSFAPLARTTAAFSRAPAPRTAAPFRGA